MFDGLTALVTGSTSGIGLGIATAFAAKGANIVLNGFGDAAAIESIRNKLATDHDVQVRYDGADLSQQTLIEVMMDKAIAEFGAIDILVNNAGEQRRHPVRRAGGRIPGRQVEDDSRAQLVRIVSRDPPRTAPDEGEEVGPDHQYRVGACARREPVQVSPRTSRRSTASPGSPRRSRRKWWSKASR